MTSKPMNSVGRDYSYPRRGGARYIFPEYNGGGEGKKAKGKFKKVERNSKGRGG